MNYIDLNNIEYGKALEIQNELFAKAISLKDKGVEGENNLLFCEHPHVITIGKHGRQENLLFGKEYLSERGVSLFQIERGGDVTYHGPGQLVGYPIFDLESLGIGLRQYIYNIEEIIISLLSGYNIKAERLAGAAGVWMDTEIPAKTRKIAAIGVRSSRFVTMHGFALNVNTDLSYFSFINPCGFIDKGVTSMQKELGHEIDMETVKSKMRDMFFDIFKER